MTKVNMLAAANTELTWLLNHFSPHQIYVNALPC